jgi:hypothetical protein
MNFLPPKSRKSSAQHSSIHTFTNCSTKISAKFWTTQNYSTPAINSILARSENLEEHSLESQEVSQVALSTNSWTVWDDGTKKGNSETTKLPRVSTD